MLVLQFVLQNSLKRGREAEREREREIALLGHLDDVATGGLLFDLSCID